MITLSLFKNPHKNLTFAISYPERKFLPTVKITTLGSILYFYKKNSTLKRNIDVMKLPKYHFQKTYPFQSDTNFNPEYQLFTDSL